MIDAVALALIDVDYFMEINKLGHDVGDHVLQTIAEVLKEEASDTGVFRVSGDEFAVVLIDNTLEQAFLKTESIRAAICSSQDRFRRISNQLPIKSLLRSA